MDPDVSRRKGGVLMEIAFLFLWTSSPALPETWMGNFLIFLKDVFFVDLALSIYFYYEIKFLMLFLDNMKDGLSNLHSVD